MRKAEREAEARKKKRMLLTVAAVVCFALFLLMVNVVIPTRRYKAAEKLEAEGKHFEAAAAFFELAGYERCPDALERSMQQWENIAVRTGFGTGYYHVAVLNSDGTVSAKGQDGGRLDVQDWTDMVSVSAGTYHTVGLKTDGTVIAEGLNADYQCQVSSWTDIVAIAAGESHTVGLKPDGTAVAVGNKGYGRIDVTEWSQIPVPQR